MGTRLRPLTLACPKPLLTLWGVPLLEHALRLLESWGVEDVAVNAHWQADKIRAYLDGRRGRATTCCSYEPEILGTGGALRPLRGFAGDEPFWVLNADIAAAVEAAPLLRAFEAGDGLGAAWLEPKKGPRTVEADRSGRITCYRSPTPGVAGTFTFCGLQILSPEIYDFLPEGPFCTLVQVYEQALAAGRFIRGVTVRGSYWDDVGTPEAYLRVHGDVKCAARYARSGGRFYNAGWDRRGTEEPSFFCVGPAARVSPLVRGADSVVCGTATVEAGSTLKRSVVAGGSVGGALSGAMCVAAGEAGDDALPATLEAMGWDAAGTAAEWLGARGSNRSFWRLRFGERSAVYIRYSLERPENGRYATHAALLARAGVPVPAVLADLPTVSALALEDWGGDSLQRLMEAHPEKAETWYTRVVEALARFHRDGTREVEETGAELEPPFDEALYAWEHRLFASELLAKRYGYETLPADVAEELSGVASRLLRARQVVVHRDCQSSNILFRGKRFVFIDFQGMRLGPAAYDLASLLYDPYVKLTPSFRTRLAAHFGACRPEDPEAVELLHEGAVQRLTQALGAFGRLAGVGQPEFVRHILPALENLLEAADACELEALGGLAEELIAREQSRCGV